MNSRRAMWMALPAVVAVSGAWPASAETYLNESQALAVVFGKNANVKREQQTLDAAKRGQLQQASGLQFREGSYTFFVNEQSGHPNEFAVVLNEIGKSEPITFMVGMSADGKITDVAIMVFRENRGWEVKEKRFLNQFHGKSLRNSIRVGEDIINYTGATLSSKAIARGAKRALLLLDAFYPRESRNAPRQSGQLVMPSYSLPLTTLCDERGTIGLYRQRRFRMGTVCEIRAWSRSSPVTQRAFNAGFAEIERLEQMFSAYRDDSELSLANRESRGKAVQVSQEFFDLTRYAIRATRVSNRAFDPTVGPLSNIWGLRTGEPRIPSSAELSEAMKLVGAHKLILEPGNRTIRFRHRGMSLDFGGLAKGYAAQRTAQMMREWGMLATLVNLGGSSISTSVSADSAVGGGLNAHTRDSINSWPISVIDPEDPSESVLAFVMKAGQSLATSGTNEKQFRVGDRLFSHLFNPISGWPLEGVRTATSVTDSGCDSEVLSKQLLAMSERQRAAYLKASSPIIWSHIEVSPTKKRTIETNLS